MQNKAFEATLDSAHQCQRSAAKTRSDMSIQSDSIHVRSFLQEKPIARAQRPTTIAAVVGNDDDKEAVFRPRLILPKGVRLIGANPYSTVPIGGRAEKRLAWQIEADEATPCELVLQIAVGDQDVTTASLSMIFLSPVKIEKQQYIPEPHPVRTPLLIGAHHCPLWEADKPQMWDNILKHPERTPALGFYSQENPEVSDWETKWAVEHGISFFIYCWYRTSQGGPVTTAFSSAIHDAFFKSKFADKIKFTIMWENQNKGHAGVADENDLMTNLLPFWMENYFKHPSYLKVDNKPLLFIYVPGRMWGPKTGCVLDDLGGVKNVKRAFDKMRAACQKEGFDGLTILGEYRGTEPEYLKSMKEMGFDYTFAYCWQIPDNPTPQQAIDKQMEFIRKVQGHGIIPQITTVSQAWSGWQDEGTIWKIPPRDYETLLRQARDFMATLSPADLSSKMLILDNWNEWGEGHYIAPYREYGFGYLDAVRKVFAGDSGPHVDLIPEDIGFGPYDTAYKAHQRREKKPRKGAEQKQE